MPKHRLALALMASMVAVVLADVIATLALSSAHKPYLGLLVSASATIPGFVIAVLAWRGKLPVSCRPKP